MKSEESLKKLGTISLGTEFMKQMIQYGELVYDEKTSRAWIDRELNPHALCFELWMCFVPELFRRAAQYYMTCIASCYIQSKATQQTIDEIISKFQSQMDASMKDGTLDDQGWTLR